eukprot:1451735-Pyramimonas_sp.AAC.1
MDLDISADEVYDILHAHRDAFAPAGPVPRETLKNMYVNCRRGFGRGPRRLHPPRARVPHPDVASRRCERVETRGAH